MASASRSKSLSVMSGRWRRVETTSHLSPSLMTLSGLWTLRLEGGAVGIRGAEVVARSEGERDRPIGDFVNHCRASLTCRRSTPGTRLSDRRPQVAQFPAAGFRVGTLGVVLDADGGDSLSSQEGQERGLDHHPQGRRVGSRDGLQPQS